MARDRDASSSTPGHSKDTRSEIGYHLPLDWQRRAVNGICHSGTSGRTNFPWRVSLYYMSIREILKMRDLEKKSSRKG
jgi:hypothetical protein